MAQFENKVDEINWKWKSNMASKQNSSGASSCDPILEMTKKKNLILEVDKSIHEHEWWMHSNIFLLKLTCNSTYAIFCLQWQGRARIRLKVGHLNIFKSLVLKENAIKEIHEINNRSDLKRLKNVQWSVATPQHCRSCTPLYSCMDTKEESWPPLDLNIEFKFSEKNVLFLCHT